MPKKLSTDQQSMLLDAGVAEFAKHGVDKANVNIIAKNAGLSVGVIYKYYENKEDFFRACIKLGVLAVSEAIHGAAASDDKILVRAEKLIRAIQASARTKPDYNALYLEVTSGRCSKYAPDMAQEIEAISAATYSEFIAQAQREGLVRSDVAPQMLAFFFDSLLMTLQFSYCCDYYRERLAIYCGEAALTDDELMVEQLLKFLESAFSVEQVQIPHDMALAGASGPVTAKPPQTDTGLIPAALPQKQATAPASPTKSK